MKLHFAFLILLAIVAMPQAAFMQEMSTAAAENDGRHDFDFFIGTWKIANRRLKPDSENDWIEFSSITVDRSFIDGLGNMDEMTLPKNHRGISLRFFDPNKKEWSIYWAKSPTGVLELPPVIGHFVGSVGKFYSDDVDAHDKPVKVRYTWTHPSVDQAYWNMAFSYDRVGPSACRYTPLGRLPAFAGFVCRYFKNFSAMRSTAAVVCCSDRCA